MAINYQDCWTYPKEKIDQLIGKAIQYKDGKLTAATGVTLAETRVVQRGCVVEINFYATLSAQIGSSVKKLVTIEGVAIPPANRRFVAATGTYAYNAKNAAYAVLNTDGEIEVLAGTTTDTVVTGHLVYTVD